MKKGFTLIELLAVIVILAIIALIATPIVLSIISDSKESASLRSAEMYLDAVEYAIADTIMNNKTISNGKHTIMEDGNICIGTYSNKVCTGAKIKVEVNGETPKEGSTITIEEGKIKDINLSYGDKTIIKDIDGNLVYEIRFDDICKYQNNGVAEKTAGAKYSCEVKPGTSYNFYVLKTPSEGDATINLIMDQNINSDGTPAGKTGIIKNGENVYNLVAWISDTDYGCEGNSCATNDKGPVTAMTFLYNATKDWTNISPLNYTYNDKELQETTPEMTTYTSFKSENGVATITALSGSGITIGSEAEPLRARMPIVASYTTITEVTSKTDASYLYDNLDTDGLGSYGYWTLSSRAGIYSGAYYVENIGYVERSNVYYNYGVRPVINLKI